MVGIAAPGSMPAMEPSDSEEDGNWFAVRTRARAEKAVERILTRSPAEPYLPLVEVERRWSDRTKRVAMPLFPGYLFIRCRHTSIPVVAATPGVVGIVRFDGEPVPVRPDEIAAVRALVRGVNRSGTLPTAAEYLAVGDPVRVVEGPFSGLEGTLVETRGRLRVVVQLHALRQAVGVELDRAHLRAVPRRT